MSEVQRDIFKSNDTGITYYLQPLEGDTYEKGFVVHYRPEDGEINKVAFIIEPELVKVASKLIGLAEQLYRGGGQGRATLALAESLGLIEAIDRGNVHELLTGEMAVDEEAADA